MKEGPERIDYQETPDVTEVHAAVKREHSEPTAEVTPIPLWLTGLCGLAVAWAGAYLGVFHGGFKGTVYNEYQSNPVELFPLPGKQGAGTEASTLTLAQQGKLVYGQCVGCHGAGGAGAPGQFPALAGAHFVTGSEKRLVAIILKGLTGPIEGKAYSGNMIAWEASMPDKKIAAVASYVRQEWGNKAPEISEAKVAAARKEFASRTTQWTEADLLQIPEDATLPDAAGAAPAGAPTDGAKSAAPALAPPAGAPAPVPAPAPAGAPAPAPAPAAAAPAAASFDLKASVERGKPLYMITCIACHQPTGMGLPGAFPPLAKSEYVTGDARRMVAIMIKGLQGPVTINGTLYNNIMLPLDLQFPQLKDDKNVADVANYARQNFGNAATEPVTPELVTAVRAEFAGRATPWMEADIKNFPAPPAK